MHLKQQKKKNIKLRATGQIKNVSEMGSTGQIKNVSESGPMQWILILISPCHYCFVKPKLVFFNILPLDQ